MEVNIKKFHPNAVVPSYAKDGDAGMDLTAVTKEYDKDGNVCYGIGLGFEIPDGYVGLIFPRSSNSKKDLLLSNSVGVIDSGYRGEVGFKFKQTIECDLESLKEYEVGDRIGQIIILPYPKIKFNLVDELNETERGSGGFGSSGK